MYTKQYILYGGGSRPSIGKEFRQTRNLEMKCYRRIIGSTRQERARNGIIKDELGQFHIEGGLKIKYL